MKTKWPLLFFLLSVVFFVLSVRSVFAKDFSSFYKTTYEFNSQGETKVNQEISLINNTSDLYISEYNLSIFGGEVSKVEAFDKIGPLQKKLNDNGSSTVINLKFNEKAVGKGKVLSFILKYQFSDIAKKEGSLWQIAVPKLTNENEIDDYQLTLKIPNSFGKISYVTPPPLSQETKDDFTYLNFNKSGLKDFGVIATFGGSQTFDFRFLYDLKNDSLSKKFYRIALPPDTRLQTIFYTSIIPEPEDVEVDEDGNWLAIYTLPPGKTLQVEASGIVDIFSSPKKDFLEKTENLNTYLKPQQYWQSESPRIKQLADELKTPEKIYRYVVKSLTYDETQITNRTQRKGALGALDSPKSCLCMEFTDLFISLCRAAGIPARELQGYAYTDNQKILEITKNNDLLHSWPEYFDINKNEWIMVDPTWENTTGGLDYFNKFDMTHFVFVTHGINDVYPLPAGSYRINGDRDDSAGSNGRKLFITFGKQTNFPKDSVLSVESVSPALFYTAKLTNSVITFKNNSGIASYNGKISSNGITNPEIVSYEIIPPFGRLRINYEIRPKEYLSDYEMEIDFNHKGQVLVEKLSVKSIILRAAVAFGIIIIILFTTLIFLIRRKKLITDKVGGNLNLE